MDFVCDCTTSRNEIEAAEQPQMKRRPIRPSQLYEESPWPDEVPQNLARYQPCGQIIYGLSDRMTKNICLEIEMTAHLPGFCSHLTFIFTFLLLRTHFGPRTVLLRNVADPFS